MIDIDLVELKDELEEWQGFYKHPADKKQHAFFTALIGAIEQLEAAQLEIAEAKRFYDEGASMLCGQYDDLAAAMGWSSDLAEKEGLSQLEYARLLKLRAELHDKPAVPDGWKLVPVEPAWQMIDAAIKHHEGEAFLPVSLYKAMMAAAPTPGVGSGA